MTIGNWPLALIWAALAIATLAIPDFSDLPNVPYCQERGCCQSRNDICAAPIIGTLCYCDDFCDQHGDGDCCPDFWSHCKGMPQEIKACKHKGQTLKLYETIKDNCNDCKCIFNNVTLSGEVLCEQHVCLMEPDMTSTINSMSDRFGFTATNYSKFWGRTLQDGIQLRLGTLQPQNLVRRMNPVRKIYDPNSLPSEFDAEEAFKLRSHIQDQGWCGSSWAISTAALASDRFKILSKGLENINLSPQHLLSCDNRGQQSCSGGHLDRAWMFIRKFGIVDEDCFPYTGKVEKCHIPRKGNLLTARCAPPPNKDRTDKYRVGPVYRLGNETDIMYEMMHSGPVQATMKVYHDFYAYKDGIYKHTDLAASHRTGYHSVRIVGWGEDYTRHGTKKYWKVANSWGREWGDNGYFKIARGTNECDIESFVLGIWPEIQLKSKK